MAKPSILHSTGLAAAALAMLAAPIAAQAQDQGGHRRGGGWNGGAPAGAPAAVQPQGPAAGAAQPQGWSGGNRWNHGGATATQAPAEAPAPAQRERGGMNWQRGPAVQPAPAPVIANPVIPAPERRPDAGNRGGWQGGGGSAPVARVPDQPRNPGNWQGRDNPRGEWQGRDNPRGNWQGRDNPRGNWQGERQGRGERGWQGTPQAQHRDWSRDWNRDNRYDWRGWRNNHRDTYRLGRYQPPYRSYAYRRLSLGFFLEPLFFGQQYVIYDPWVYRLPEAYEPYQWVRYYNDAVLVDSYTGRVVDVLYDFFW